MFTRVYCTISGLCDDHVVYHVLYHVVYRMAIPYILVSVCDIYPTPLYMTIPYGMVYLYILESRYLPTPLSMVSIGISRDVRIVGTPSDFT